MHYVFRVNEVILDPIDIIAPDRDHAAQILLTALRDGLEYDPGAKFSISHWTARRLKRYDRLQRWANERRAGVIWPTPSGDDWKLVSYDLDGS